jgi:Uma2 family endonuclease
MATTRQRPVTPSSPEEADFPRPVTWAEWRQMPEENRIIELWRGEVVMSPAASRTHQRVVFLMATALEAAVQQRGVGEMYIAPFDVRLGVDTVLQPDVLVVSGGTGAVVHEGWIDGPPDLVVEVVSASGRRRDYVRKLTMYRDAGVPEYWIIEPALGRVVINSLRSGEYYPEIVDGATVACVALGEAEIDISWLQAMRDDSAGVREESAEYDAGSDTEPVG